MQIRNVILKGVQKIDYIFSIYNHNIPRNQDDTIT